VITVRVPGARTVSVYCGGEPTVHADGSEARIEPRDTHCFIEAPWSPAMPLRGEFDLTGRPVVECRRDNMKLVCR